MLGDQPNTSIIDGGLVGSYIVSSKCALLGHVLKHRTCIKIEDCQTHPCSD